jgi:hypothetical protein
MGVPDTNTFTLQDVVDEVNPSSPSLRTCFDQSDPNYFDNNYIPSGFDPHSYDKTGYRLSYFRNYGSHNAASISISPNNYSAAQHGETFGLDIDVSPAGASWTVTTDVSWISISPSSGSGDYNGVNIEVSGNWTGFQRFGSVTVSLDNYSYSASCFIDQPG